MHSWVKNPKAPSSLWDGLVVDGAYAGLHPGTNRFVDGSGLENHGTLTNMDAATDWVWVPELGRWALDFDGSNDYVLFPKLPITGASQAFSISMFALTRTSALNLLFQQWTTINSGPIMWVNDTSTIWQVGSKSYDRITATSSWAVGQYRHVCGVYGGDTSREDNVQLFVGGTLHGQNYNGINITTADAGTIGGPLTGGITLLNGVIAELLVHNRALAPEEITWLADRSNRLYVSDTRRHFWFPQGGIKPWQIRRRRRMAGAR
jgi:hypothetical protein